MKLPTASASSAHHEAKRNHNADGDAAAAAGPAVAIDAGDDGCVELRVEWREWQQFCLVCVVLVLMVRSDTDVLRQEARQMSKAGKDKRQQPAAELFGLEHESLTVSQLYDTHALLQGDL